MKVQAVQRALPFAGQRKACPVFGVPIRQAGEAPRACGPDPGERRVGVKGPMGTLL